MAVMTGLYFWLIQALWVGVLHCDQVAAKNSDSIGKDGVALAVEHAIDTGSDLVFQPRTRLHQFKYAARLCDYFYVSLAEGVIDIKNMKGSSGSYKDDRELESSDLEGLKTAAAKGHFYHIRIPLQADTASGEKAVTYLSTFIKACSLLQSNLSDIIKLHLDNTGRVFAVGLSTTTADCSDFNSAWIGFESFERFNTTVVLSHVTPGPAPDTQTYIRKLEEERRENEQGKGKDNRSFFAKYWMYIVPLVIFLLLSGQEPPATGGGAAAGGGGGGGGGN